MSKLNGMSHEYQFGEKSKKFHLVNDHLLQKSDDADELYHSFLILSREDSSMVGFCHFTFIDDHILLFSAIFRNTCIWVLLILHAWFDVDEASL